MRTLTRIVTSLFLGYSCSVSAQKIPEIPPVCNNQSGTVALIDCLQNQQEILRRVLEYQQLVAKISEIRSIQPNTPPQIPDDKSATQQDPGMDRVNWFDQNLEVYAITGSPESLTAYVRLAGRDYRLQPGDVIRLARVLKVHSRGVDLLVAGHEISIGLSGQSESPRNKNESISQ